MRNLKRALSLTLASVMLLGMMIVGTSAAASFNDAADISNVTAATILQDTKIMQGSGGNFMPGQTVTRGQMAIIICKMLYGDKLNVNQFSGTQQFDDVPAGQYYTGYVNLAASLGIISGYGNGNFGPGDPVSTAQAALMLCRALGYFQAGELKGQSWADNALTAITKATQLGLFGTMRLETNAELSRDNVAEMAFNALTKVTPVQYNETWNMYYTDSESMFTGVKFRYDETLGYRNYELVYTTDEDDFGRPTTVWGYAQLKNSGTSSYLKDNGDIDTDVFTIASLPSTSQITEVPNAPTASYDGKVSRATLYSLVGRSAVDKLEASSGTGSDADAPDWHIISDGQELSRAKAEVFAQNDSTCIGRTSAGSVSDLTGAGSHTDVYIDSNGEVTIAIANTYLLQATNDYSSRNDSVTTTNISNNGPKASAAISFAKDELTLKGEDFNISGVKLDDYLLVTVAGNAANNKEIQSVEPATVITGVVDRFSTDDVTIAGTKYSYGFTADDTSSHGKAVEYAVKEETVVVADNTEAHNILYVDEVTVAAGRYVYVSGIQTKTGNFTSGDYVAQAYFLDGTRKTIDIKDKYKGGASVDPDDAGAWFRYTVNSSDEYTLEVLTGGNKENNTGTATSGALKDDKLVESGKVRVGASGTSVNANDGTIFVIRDKDDEIKAYTGIKNAPTVQMAANGTPLQAEYVLGQGGFAKYIFIDAKNNGSVKGAVSSDYIYLLKQVNTGVDEGEDTYVRFEALVNGEIVKTLDVNDDVNPTVGSLYANVRYTDKGYVSGMDVVTDSEDYVAYAANDYSFPLTDSSVFYDNSGLRLGSASYVVGADAKVYLIAKDGNVKTDAGADYLVVDNGEIRPANLYGTLRNYLVTGEYWVQTDGGDAKDVVKTLYVLVTGTKKAGDGNTVLDENSTGSDITTELGKTGVDHVVAANPDLTGGLGMKNDLGANETETVTLTGDITGGNITGGTAGKSTVEIAGNLTGTTNAAGFAGKVVVTGETTVASGASASLPADTKLDADLTVKGTVTLKDDISGKGAIVLDGGELVLNSTDIASLPKIEGAGKVTVSANTGNNGGAGNLDKVIDMLASESTNTVTGNTTNGYTGTFSANPIKVDGTAQLGEYSGTKTIADAKGWWGSPATVEFQVFRVPAAVGDTVKLYYNTTGGVTGVKESEGTKTGWTAMTSVAAGPYGTGAAGSTVTTDHLEGHDYVEILMPVGNNVKQIMYTVKNDAASRDYFVVFNFE